MLMRTSSLSLTDQLVARFTERIRNRLLAAGARLPSVRQCAVQHGVSPHTVVAAYDQLVAAGLVEARKQRGFYVRDIQNSQKNTKFSDVDIDKFAINSGVSKLSVADIPGGISLRASTGLTGRLQARIDATALIRGMFHHNRAGLGTDWPQPGMGVFPPEWLESDFMSAAVRKVTQSKTLLETSLKYGEPKGDTGLRNALSTKLRDLSIDVPPEHIITSMGATHGLDIVSRTLLKAGDCVMVEEPGWAVEFARLDALGMRILPVPRGPDGPDLDVMARYCTEHAPKMFVSVSVFHNPTGYTLSPGSAHRILQLANQHDFHIVEDDTYSHIAPAHATRMCALDGLQRTIYVSGFAKILAPNWRVGYIAAPADLVERLLDTKLLSALTTPALLEKAMAICIEQGHLRRHAERIRARLDAARTRSARLALQAGCTFAAEPAGLFGWVDTGVDTDVLAQHMLDDGYLLAPGALFHASRNQPSTLMRINFASTQEAAFWKVFSRQKAALLAHQQRTKA
jgi:DNA-binding transcriptional MocR family regulator